LPNLFSLHIEKNPSSRLIAGSKMLENESIQFVNRKRGRPEGSTQKRKQSIGRKSVRLETKKEWKHKFGQKEEFEEKKKHS
jgi:Cu/Ag efflux pump CusA